PAVRAPCGPPPLTPSPPAGEGRGEGDRLILTPSPLAGKGRGWGDRFILSPWLRRVVADGRQRRRLEGLEYGGRGGPGEVAIDRLLLLALQPAADQVLQVRGLEAAGSRRGQLRRAGGHRGRHDPGQHLLHQEPGQPRRLQPVRE